MYQYEIVLLREDFHKEETVRKLKDILGGGMIDLLFIDGDHRYEGVRKDFEMYSPSSLHHIIALACQQEKP